MQQEKVDYGSTQYWNRRYLNLVYGVEQRNTGSQVDNDCGGDNGNIIDLTMLINLKETSSFF
jgi:hypothetical protein